MTNSPIRSQTRTTRKKSVRKSPESSVPPRTFPRGVRQGKVRKEFWLDPELLRIVKGELGVSTEREAVEMALDLVVFRKELTQGARRLTELGLQPLDE